MPNRQLLQEIQKRQRELRLQSLNPSGVKAVMEIKNNYVKKDDLEDFKDSITRLIAKFSSELDSLREEAVSSINATKSKITATLTAETVKIRRDFEEKIKSIENELGTSFDDIENLKNTGAKIPDGLIKKINEFVVQRSVSIPVSVDQGGTGLTNNNFVYVGGTATTEGAWRFTITGSDLNAERLESGTWVAKGGFTA